LSHSSVLSMYVRMVISRRLVSTLLGAAAIGPDDLVSQLSLKSLAFARSSRPLSQSAWCVFARGLRLCAPRDLCLRAQSLLLE
jgi:hypothetical protein